MRNHRTSPKPTRATDGEGHSKSDSTVGGEWKRRFREERCEREKERLDGAEIDAGDNLLVGREWLQPKTDATYIS